MLFSYTVEGFIRLQAFMPLPINFKPNLANNAKFRIEFLLRELSLSVAKISEPLNFFSYTECTFLSLITVKELLFAMKMTQKSTKRDNNQLFRNAMPNLHII